MVTVGGGSAIVTARAASIPLGHAVSARFHVDNGITHAIVLPQVLRFNAQAAPAGLDKIADALGVARSAGRPPLDGVIAAPDALFDRLALPRRLREVGVTRESLADRAAVSMEDWFVRDNPRAVRDAGELQQVLSDAW